MNFTSLGELTRIRAKNNVQYVQYVQYCNSLSKFLQYNDYVFCVKCL